MNVCDSKVMYDTEFEATLAAARKDWDAVPYQCKGTKHWHIAHKNKSERMGYGYKMMKCPKCGDIVRRKGASKHVGKCRGRLRDVHQASEGDTRPEGAPSSDGLNQRDERNENQEGGRDGN